MPGIQITSGILQENLIIKALETCLAIWQRALNHIWMLLTTTPQEFKGGHIWNIVVNINDAVKAIAIGLLVLFFVMGVIKTCGSFAEIKKPEHALKLFVRFAIAKGAVTYGMELMLALFRIIQGVIRTILNAGNFTQPGALIIPAEMEQAIHDISFFKSIPVWIVALISVLVVIVLTFITVMSVYGRFFKLYIYTALAPISISTFAGEPTQNVGKSFFKGYAAVCLEGAVIVLACIMFSVFSNTSPTITSGAEPMIQVLEYMLQLIFNMLILVGTVKMSDRVIREMMGL